MKTILLIMITAAAIMLSQSHKLTEKKQITAVGQADIDSVLEARRVEIMRYKMQ